VEQPDPLVKELAGEAPDFSLVLGGPLFQLWRRTHLTGDGLELPLRRVGVISLFVWLPLLILSMIDRTALHGTVRVSFLHDIEAHVRFLIALPILIVSEVVVHRRVSPLVRRFVQRSIIVSKDLPRFYAAVNSALRIRNSVLAEGMLFALVYTAGLWIWKSQVALDEPTWYGMREAKQLHLSSAGYWYTFVSIPIFQFILARWYMRLGIWFRLLWQISRLDLRLTAAHPDRAGGIGFVGKSSYAFGPILFAQGTLLSGVIASRVLYDRQSLLSFKMEAAGFVGFFVFAVLAPLVMFTPMLESARRKGSAQYGLLASRYIFGFEDKWIQAGDPEMSKLLGSNDIQSMADMANVCANVRQMRLVPFGTDDITRLALATAAPLLPLALTMFSVPELAKFLVKIVFK